jgi:predicted nucleic acid-binding protein
MRVLLDADILIDVALDRAPHAEPSAALLDELERRPGTAFIAWHTASNFYYLVAPTRGRKGTREFLLDLTDFVDVSPTTVQSLRYATRLPLSDFEDALQVAAALACGAEVIATRNVGDYVKSPVRAMAPQFVLRELR